MTKEQMLFKTPYGNREHHFLPTGDGTENNYGYEINKTGQKVLVITGKTNIYEKIQENLEATKIENVLKSVINGDTSSLRPDGIYGDTTESPKNLIEARRMILNLENTWNSLTSEQKRKFDNDVEKFVAESGSVEWFEKLDMIPKETPQAITEAKTESAPSAEGGKEA